jgi:hypothetical protein
MKLLVAAFAASLLASAAFAGERENAENHIAQVIAVTKLCPKLAPNSAMLALVAVRYNIDFDRDQAELMKLVVEQIAPWKGKPEDAACAAGLMLYGPDGANIKDLVRVK